MTYTETYEKWYPEKREESLRGLQPVVYRRKKAKPETLEERARQKRYTSRKNICPNCHMARPCQCDEVSMGW